MADSRVVKEFRTTLKNAQRQNRDQVVSALRRAASRGEAHIKDYSVDEAFDEGIFAAAWETINQPDGAVLVNSVPYAAILEDGSRPHWPPLYPILAWVGRKENHPVDGYAISPKSGKYDLSDQQPFKDNPELEQLRLRALAIARHIAAHGTAAKHLLANSQDTFANHVEQELNRIPK